MAAAFDFGGSEEMSLPVLDELPVFTSTPEKPPPAVALSSADSKLSPSDDLLGSLPVACPLPAKETTKKKKRKKGVLRVRFDFPVLLLELEDVVPTEHTLSDLLAAVSWNTGLSVRDLLLYVLAVVELGCEPRTVWEAARGLDGPTRNPVADSMHKTLSALGIPVFAHLFFSAAPHVARFCRDRLKNSFAAFDSKNPFTGPRYGPQAAEVVSFSFDFGQQAANVEEKKKEGEGGEEEKERGANPLRAEERLFFDMFAPSVSAQFAAWAVREKGSAQQAISAYLDTPDALQSAFWRSTAAEDEDNDGLEEHGPDEPEAGFLKRKADKIKRKR